MFKGRERRFSSAHAIAIAALFFALGGGAYAAVSSLPPNSVGTKQLRDGSVTPAKLARSVGMGPRLTAKQKKELKKLLKRLSKPGPTGSQGPKGEQGRAGPPGPSDLYTSGRHSGNLTNLLAELASTSVPPGQYLIQAKVNLSSQVAGESGEALCFIGPSSNPSNGEWDSARNYLSSPPGIVSEGEIFLSGVATFDATSPVALSCGGAETLGYDTARVWAIKLGSLQQSG